MTWEIEARRQIFFFFFFRNVFLHLIHFFLHLLIKSISPSPPPPFTSISLVLSVPLFSASLSPSLLLSISLARSLPCVTSRLQLIDDERNLPRTGALLKTGQCVLSVGASGDGGGESGGITKRGAPWYPNPALPVFFFFSSSSSSSLFHLFNLLLPAFPFIVYRFSFCIFCSQASTTSPFFWHLRWGRASSPEGR